MGHRENPRRLLQSVLLIWICVFSSSSLCAQQKHAADELVNKGVVLQDKGEVDSALSEYNQALSIDKDNLLVLAEMAYSLVAIEKYDEAINYAKKAIKTHPRDPVLQSVYVSYGNALDGLGKTDKAIDIYNDALKLYPEYYQLYFNRGICQNKLHKTEDAILSFQRSAELNPNHPGTQNALGLLLYSTTRIPSLFAFCRYLILSPNGKRAGENLNIIETIMIAHVEKSDDKNVTIEVTPEMLNPNKGKQKNNFSSAELMLSLNSALDSDSSNIRKSAVEKFIRKFSDLCGYLKEIDKDNYGFYWDYYVPYFTEMNDRNLLEPFAYIVFASSKNEEVTAWLTSHKSEVTVFYKWSNEFKWRIN